MKNPIQDREFAAVASKHRNTFYLYRQYLTISRPARKLDVATEDEVRSGDRFVESSRFERWVRRVKGSRMALMALVIALLATTASARFEEVRSPGMTYGGAVGGERFDSVEGPTMRYDGYFGGHAYSSNLDRWVSIGWVFSEPEIDIREIAKAHQERFNLARSVFGSSA
jgi:hypothetical protein